MADVETPVRDDVEENTDALDESTVSEGGAAETENGEVGEAGGEENGEDEGDGGGDEGDDAEAMDDDEKVRHVRWRERRFLTSHRTDVRRDEEESTGDARGAGAAGANAGAD